jgi:hypothetical protein
MKPETEQPIFVVGTTDDVEALRAEVVALAGTLIENARIEKGRYVVEVEVPARHRDDIVRHLRPDAHVSDSLAEASRAFHAAAVEL